MTALNIVPECYVDTKLAEILAQSSKKIYHHKGHGNVANKMLKLIEKDQSALGLIDQDNLKIRKSKYFAEFIELDRKNELILKIHPSNKQYLILINPAIEKWLIQAAQSIELSLPEKLGNQLKDLTDFTKRQRIHTNIYFYQFIKELIRKQAPGIITLKTWIEKFLAHEELV